jgi:hypothetical protein
MNTSCIRDPDFPSQRWALDPRNPEAVGWAEATVAEVKSLLNMGALRTVLAKDIPNGSIIMRSLFAYRQKRDEHANPTRKKARWVCDGSTYPKDEDCHSPTAQMSTVKLHTAFAVAKGTGTHQTDVTLAYCEAPMHRSDVYMYLPSCLKLRDENGNALAMHCVRSLYGAPPSGKNWYNHILSWAKRNGFTQSLGDPCLWVKRKAGHWIVVVVFVDDMNVSSDCPQFLLDEFIKPLITDFPARYEGNTSWFLGTSISQSLAQPPPADNYKDRPPTVAELTASNAVPKAVITNTQKLRELLVLTHMSDCTSAPTPMETGVDKLLRSSRSEDPPEDSAKLSALEAKLHYAHTVSSLMFVARSSRPDILFSVNLCARFMRSPRIAHYTALIRILRYISGTLDLGLCYTADGDDTIRFYTDSSHQDDTDSRQSSLGFVATWKGAAIMYHSQKSERVAFGTAESELYALHAGMRKALAVAKDLSILGIKPDGPMAIYVDNNATCSNVQNRSTFGRMRHVDAAFMSVHERHDLGHITLIRIDSKKNPADLFTKALSESDFLKMRKLVLGM